MFLLTKDKCIPYLGLTGEFPPLNTRRKKIKRNINLKSTNSESVYVCLRCSFHNFYKYKLHAFIGHKDYDHIQEPCNGRF